MKQAQEDVDNLQELVDKETPMKVDTHRFRECPNCKDILVFDNFKYCPNCGQKLDWSEE